MVRYTGFFLMVIAITALLEARQTDTQTPGSGDCPVAAVSCPDITKGSAIIFTANFVGDPSDKRVFRWSVSKGRITSGQGTALIKVDASGFEGQTITATVRRR